MSKYNQRNELGRFFKPRKLENSCQCGKNICSENKTNNIVKIVSGRLYEWKGNVVRAFGSIGKTGRMVCIHKTLFGVVKESQLKNISKEKVLAYLEEAKQ